MNTFVKFSSTVAAFATLGTQNLPALTDEEVFRMHRDLPTALLSEDTDSDRFTNQQELDAGTDPKNAKDRPQTHIDSLIDAFSLRYIPAFANQVVRFEGKASTSSSWQFIANVQGAAAGSPVFVERLVKSDFPGSWNFRAVEGTNSPQPAVVQTLPPQIALRWDSKDGIQYTWKDSPNLASGSWAPVPGATYLGTEYPMAVRQDIGSNSRFYKLESTRVDTDSDGISDWSELVIGTDPLLSDSDSDGFSDQVEISNESDLLEPYEGLNLSLNSATGFSKILPWYVPGVQSQSYSLALSVDPYPHSFSTSINTDPIVNISPAVGGPGVLVTGFLPDGEDGYVERTIPPFKWQGEIVTSIFIWTDGRITFIDPSVAYSPTPPSTLPSGEAQPNCVMPFSKNLSLLTTGRVYIHTNSSTGAVTIQWDRVTPPPPNPPPLPEFTFQLVLTPTLPGGIEDGLIKFRYISLPPPAKWESYVCGWQKYYVHGANTPTPVNGQTVVLTPTFSAANPDWLSISSSTATITNPVDVNIHLPAGRDWSSQSATIIARTPGQSDIEIPVNFVDDENANGLDDDWETFYNVSNPYGDPSGGGVTNRVKLLINGNPNAQITYPVEQAGLTDGFLLKLDLIPDLAYPGLANEDPDGDGLSNIAEQARGTDPLNKDTDGDGIPDLFSKELP